MKTTLLGSLALLSVAFGASVTGTNICSEADVAIEPDMATDANQPEASAQDAPTTHHVFRLTLDNSEQSASGELYCPMSKYDKIDPAFYAQNKGEKSFNDKNHTPCCYNHTGAYHPVFFDTYAPCFVCGFCTDFP